MSLSSQHSRVFCTCFSDHRTSPSFPTRRSSDLLAVLVLTQSRSALAGVAVAFAVGVVWTLRRHRLAAGVLALVMLLGDRKSTRLNSSHLVISYAVFCLKKNIVQRRQLIRMYLPS